MSTKFQGIRDSQGSHRDGTSVLTSGDLAGVNLLAWFVFIRRREVFHGMECEFRLKVIYTHEKRQNHSGYRGDPSFDSFQEHTGCASGAGISMISIYFSFFTV